MLLKSYFQVYQLINRVLKRSADDHSPLPLPYSRPSSFLSSHSTSSPLELKTLLSSSWEGGGVLSSWEWWRVFCDSKAYHNSYAAISSYTWIFLFSCIITMIVNAFKSHSSKEWNSFVKPMTPLGFSCEGDPSLISRMFTQNLTPRNLSYASNFCLYNCLDV